MRVLTTILLLLISATATRSDEPVTARVSPGIVMAGRDATVRLTCRVVRHPDNRKLEYGLEGYSSSERQLDGEASRVTWETFITHIPCGVERAFCIITRADRRTFSAFAPLVVAGCDGP